PQRGGKRSCREQSAAASAAPAGAGDEADEHRTRDGTARQDQRRSARHAEGYRAAGVCTPHRASAERLATRDHRRAAARRRTSVGNGFVIYRRRARVVLRLAARFTVLRRTVRFAAVLRAALRAGLRRAFVAFFAGLAFFFFAAVLRT